MHNVNMKLDRSMIMTITVDPAKVSRGHLALTGAGKHTDKRLRRTNRKSRNQNAIREWN